MTSPDLDLDSRIRALCRDAGLEATRVEWLPADLSLRRFARVHTTSRDTPTLVARVESAEDPAGRPAGVAPEPALEPIRALLEANGLPVPRRFGGDAAQGIDLIEDVGDLSLRVASGRLPPAERRALHRETCEWLPRLQRIAPVPGIAAFTRELDAPLFAYKADLVIRHGLPARGRATSPAEADAVRSAFARIAAEHARGPRRLAHRDLQSANVFVRPGAAPGARLRWIDLQGAFLAAPEYDLVCLLRDSYVELPEEEIAEHVAAVRPLLPDAPDAETFARRFDLLTLTRKGKDHARFLYAARERGDRRFLAHVPLTVRHLRGAAERSAARDPGLIDLASLIHELPEQPCAR